MGEDWISSLVKERDKADKRLVKLNNFINGKTYSSIAPQAQQLILIQSTAMATYINAMNGRLRLLGGNYSKEKTYEYNDNFDMSEERELNS